MAAIIEKAVDGAQHLVIDETPPSTVFNEEIQSEFSTQEQKKIIHRIDRRLVTTLGVLYCVSLMDRTNLGVASIAGLTIELDMETGFRYVSSS